MSTELQTCLTLDVEASIYTRQRLVNGALAERYVGPYAISVRKVPHSRSGKCVQNIVVFTVVVRNIVVAVLVSCLW